MAEIPEPKTRLEQYWAGILDKIEGGGSGNPNYVETIEGTLANPWGNYSYGTIIQDIADNNITAYLMMTMHPQHIQYSGFPTSGWVSVSATISAVTQIQYTGGGVLNFAREYSGFSTYTDIDPATPCTLTIIHHPLPNQS